MLQKTIKRIRRHNKVRAKISWTPERPRLAIFRSNVAIYAQLIDDTTWKTLWSASDLKMKKEGSKVEMSKKVWAEIAKVAADNKIKTVVFDRGWFSFKWRVKALADAAKEAWLIF